jgi:hypothetical protein
MRKKLAQGMENSSFPQLRGADQHHKRVGFGLETLSPAAFSGLDWPGDRGYVGGLFS